MANIAGHLGGAGLEVQRRRLRPFVAADEEYGERMAKPLGLSVE